MPYPVGTDRVADGDNAMQALAERVDARVPWGVLAFIENTVQLGQSTGGGVDLGTLQRTVTLGSGRRIRILARCSASSTVPSDIPVIVVRQDGTQVAACGIVLPPVTAGLGLNIHLVTEISPAAGSHTYSVVGLRAAGTGQVTFNGAPLDPAMLSIEDIGPVVTT